MLPIVLFNMILISFLSFITSWILIEGVLFFCRIRSHRGRVLFRLIPILKLPLDMLLWNTSKWSVVYGEYPHMSKIGSRMFKISAGGLFPSFECNFSINNILGFTIADWLYGLSAKTSIACFFLLFCLFYCYKLITRVRGLLQERKLIERILSTCYYVDVNLQNMELKKCLERCRVSVVTTSEYSGSPFVTGLFKKKIVLPTKVIAFCTQQEVEAIIAHEIAHIKHADLYINTLMCAFSMVFAHVPIKRLFSKISLSQELACDKRVLSQGISKLSLMEGLFKCASHKTVPGAMFAEYSNLMKRVKAIESHKSKIAPARLLISGSLALYFATGILFGKLWTV